MQIKNVNKIFIRYRYTILLNLIGGLDYTSSGDDLCNTRRDHIGFVFQSYNLIPVLSARENIQYVMKLQVKSDEEYKERVEKIAKNLNTTKELDKLPSNLSGGQQQRVAVARALSSKPKIILADEPTVQMPLH